METNNQQILTRLTQYLIDNPEIRFCQALGNLGINQFANQTNPTAEKHQLRDNYNDSNVDVLKRMK